MSGFDLRDRQKAAGEKIVGRFTRLDPEFPIKKGDAVGTSGDALIPMPANKNGFGSTKREAYDPTTVMTAEYSQPRHRLVGVLPNGHKVFKVSSGGDYPSRLHNDNSLFVMDGAELINSISIPSGFGNVGYVAVHPLKKRIYVLRAVQNPDQNWSYSSFDVEEFDETLVSLGKSVRIDQPADYAIPRGSLNGGMVCTGDDYLVLNGRFGISNKRHCLIIYHIPTQTLKRDGSILLPGSHNTNMTMYNWGHDMMVTWLNPDNTRFLLTSFIFDYSSNRFGSSRIIEPAAAEPVSGSSIEHNWGSPAFSYDINTLCDIGSSNQEGRLIPAIQSDTNPDRIAVISPSSSQLVITIYDISDPANIQSVSSMSMSCNSSHCLVTKCSNDWIFACGISNPNLYYMSFNISDGTGKKGILKSNYISEFYPDRIILWDWVRNRIYLPYLQDSPSDVGLSRACMMEISVNLTNGTVLLDKISVYPGSFNIGYFRDAVDLGSQVLFLQGGHSNATQSTDLTYKLYDKDTMKWVDDTDQTWPKLIDQSFDQYYYLSGDRYHPYIQAISKLSPGLIQLMGFGLTPSLTSTGDDRRIEQKLVNVGTPTFIGVARADATDTGVELQLAGQAPLNDKYERIFKAVDHREIGGNAALFMGSVANIKGEL